MSLAPKPTRTASRNIALALAALFALIIGKGLWNATRDPIIRTATITSADWPEGQRPLKLLLISDIHVAGPDMPPDRLERLVERFNALRPDLILIAGDLHSGKAPATSLYSTEQIAVPLGHLRAPLGTVAVLGNHDYWYRPAKQSRALRRHGVTVLENQAIRRGPLIIGGIADDVSDHDDIPATYAAMDTLGNGPRILVTHGPDVVPHLPSAVDAVFAGHTHCGQIALPWIGALSYASRYGDRFACGHIIDKGQSLFVGAGLGTSILPLRYGAPPDAWLVTLRGSPRQ